MNLLHCLQHFLPPWVWKLGHQAALPFRAKRWQLMPLVLVAMLTMLLTARSLGERFEHARRFFTRMTPNRKRVGGVAWASCP